MSQNPTLKLFISYSRVDETFARRMATDLIARGAEAWLDVKDIPGGANWGDSIGAGLKATNTMILIMTPDSMASENVKLEWQDFFDDRKRIVPVLLKPTDVSFQIRRLQYADFSKCQTDQDYQQAFTRLWDYLIGKKVEMTAGVSDATHTGFVGLRVPKQPTRRISPGSVFGIAAVLVMLVVFGLIFSALGRPTGPAASPSATPAVADTPIALVFPSATPFIASPPTDVPIPTATAFPTATAVPPRTNTLAPARTACSGAERSRIDVWTRARVAGDASGATALLSYRHSRA